MKGTPTTAEPEIYDKRLTFTILPAVERRYGQYSAQLQVGMMIPIAYTIQDTVDSGPMSGYTQWYTVRAELRKYKHTIGKAGLYIGAELFANLLKSPRFYAGYTFDDPPPYEDAFVLTKKMIGVSTTAGFQRYISKHVLLGIHLSIGGKFKHISALNKQDNETYIMYRHDVITEEADKIGSSVTFASYLNIGVGYMFR